MASLSWVALRATALVSWNGYRISKKGRRDIYPAPFLDSILASGPDGPGSSVPGKPYFLP
jgi:hypothetical protein